LAFFFTIVIVSRFVFISTTTVRTNKRSVHIYLDTAEVMNNKLKSRLFIFQLAGNNQASERCKLLYWCDGAALAAFE
jgi:hypothetical protein